MLTQAYLAVRDFHKAFNHPAPDAPTDIPIERVNARADWVTEEADETRRDVMIPDPIDRMTKVADGYIDAIYFGLGGLVELGLDPGPLFDIVQGANMAKLHDIDGKKVAVYHPDGKVKKPDGWEDPHPQLVEEVKRQIAAAAGRKAYEAERAQDATGNMLPWDYLPRYEKAVWGSANYPK